MLEEMKHFITSKIISKPTLSLCHVGVERNVISFLCHVWLCVYASLSTPFFPPLRPRYVVQVEHITWEVSNGQISLQSNTFSYYTGVREGTYMYDRYFYKATILFNI